MPLFDSPVFDAPVFDGDATGGPPVVTLGGCCNCDNGSGGSGSGPGQWHPGTPDYDTTCADATFRCTESGIDIDYLGCANQPKVYCTTIIATPDVTACPQTIGTNYQNFWLYKATASCNSWVGCPELTCADGANNFPGDPTTTPDCRIFADPAQIGGPGPGVSWFVVMQPACKGTTYGGSGGYPLSTAFTESVMTIIIYGDNSCKDYVIYTCPLATWSCTGANTFDLFFQTGGGALLNLPASLIVTPCGTPTCLSGLV